MTNKKALCSVLCSAKSARTESPERMSGRESSAKSARTESPDHVPHRESSSAKSARTE